MAGDITVVRFCGETAGENWTPTFRTNLFSKSVSIFNSIIYYHRPINLSSCCFNCQYLHVLKKSIRINFCIQSDNSSANIAICAACQSLDNVTGLGITYRPRSLHRRPHTSRWKTDSDPLARTLWGLNYLFLQIVRNPHISLEGRSLLFSGISGVYYGDYGVPT